MARIGVKEVQDIERQMNLIEPCNAMPTWSSATVRDILTSLKEAWYLLEETRTRCDQHATAAGALQEENSHLRKKLEEHGCTGCGSRPCICRQLVKDSCRDNSPDDDSLLDTYDLLAVRRYDEEATKEVISCGKALELLESLVACRRELKNSRERCDKAVSECADLLVECDAWHALDAKIEKCHNDPRYLGVWEGAQTQQGKYKGPDYIKERASAQRKAAANERDYGFKG